MESAWRQSCSQFGWEVGPGRGMSTERRGDGRANGRMREPGPVFFRQNSIRIQLEQSSMRCDLANC
jgi:hypothetical protein